MMMMMMMMMMMKHASTDEAGIVTDSTPLIGSCVALLSCQIQLINF